MRVAKHYHIVDRPSDRSSHDYTTVRGAGIVFLITIIFWYLSGQSDTPHFIYGLVLIGLISFMDDIYTLKSGIRFFIQVCSVVLALTNFDIFDGSPLIPIIAVVLYVGWINAFNFMDGINGITALYTLSILVPLSLVSPLYTMLYGDLILFLVISIIVFMIFNVRHRALAFAGDIGSIVLAFTVGYIIIELIVNSGHIEFLLFGSVYGVDSVLTIIRRLISRQNIFTAHRDHLYQMLVNENGVHFLTVGIIYSLFQFSISLVIIYYIMYHPEGLKTLSVKILALLLLSYLATYKIAKNRVNTKN